jgi:hypothetical protein
MTHFNDEKKQLMQRYYASLSEKERRLYAGYESLNIGWGGITYIHSILGIHRSSIVKGQKELLDIEVFGEIELGKQRRKGGGRKKKRNPNLKSSGS